MTEIRFYHLTRHRLEQALPELLQKATARGMRVVVTAGSDDRLHHLDEVLWTYDPGSFLPHGRAGGAFDSEQPVLLAIDPVRTNNADVLMLTEGGAVDDLSGFSLCCDLFDGRDDAAVAAARDRWKQARDAGHVLSYWQQDDNGRWALKAEHKPEIS